MRRPSRLRVLEAGARSRWSGRALSRVLRAGALVALVLVVRWRFAAPRTEPSIGVAEVRAVLSEAARLAPDPGPRGGVHVVDEFGLDIGYAVRTLPAASDVIGYAGPTDALVVLDRRGAIAGLRIRGSADTANHVQDVKDDRAFMAQLDGLNWQEAAAVEVGSAAVDAVSGATLTSRAVIGAVARRLGGQPAAHARWQWSGRDATAALVLAAGIALAFSGRRVRRPFRVGFAVAAVLGLGLSGGDFVTQSVLLGWAREGVPWSTAPGLVLICAAALLLPWVTGRAVYCRQICPHGLVQDLVARLSPWHLAVRADLQRALRWLPRGLLVTALVWALVEAPFDPARLEPFDAYLLTAGAGASILWAVASLIAAVFVPRGYCRFGCPTGALLELARVRAR